MTPLKSPYVLANALIITCDPNRTIHQNGSLAINIEGRLEYVGAASQLPQRYQEWPSADMTGLVIMPGMVNTHTHAGLSTHRGLCDSGDLFEWAETIAPVTSTLTEADIRDGVEVAVDAMLDAGVTCACDCTRYGAGVFAEIASNRGMRSLSGALANSPELRPNGTPNWPLALQETVAAVKRHKNDGLARFYLGAHSPNSCTPELVRDIVEEAKTHGLRFTIHLAETKREVEELLDATGLTPAKWLDSLGALHPGTLLAHGVWLDNDDLDLIAERGASIAHCPGSNAKLGSGVARVPAMLQRGIAVGLGTDSMLSNNSQDIMAEMKLASLLQRAANLDASIYTSHQLIEMATIGGATALGWQDETGSLETGKAADFIGVKATHPRELTVERALSELVYSATRGDVRLVVVEGQVLRGELPL